MATTTVPQPLKWFGGKSYLAPKIIALFPPHLHYVEPYFGGGAVLLSRDPEGVSEVVNDVNFDLTTFWSVLRDPELFEKFRRKIEAMPFSEAEWDIACETLRNEVDAVDHASAFFVRCRQSMGGKMKHFAPVSRNRVRRGMNEQVSAWLTCIEGLPEVHKRLQRVLILNRDALDVIQSQDGEQTLFYLDPPYLHETRTGSDDYQHEMTYDQHSDLLAALSEIKGKFLLSGYESELYRLAADRNGWNVHRFDLPNNAAGGKTKRRMVECVWCNF